jgi:hypothetical protein
MGQGPNAWGRNHLMGFWTDFLSLNPNPIFSGFETRSKVRQADIQLRTMKSLIDTKLSLDLACQCKTQINNSIITIQNQKKTHN